MAAVIRLVPLDDRGREIIDELDAKGEEQPTEVREDGTRLYTLHAGGVDVELFDAMLSRIDSEWSEHVARTSSVMP